MKNTKGWITDSHRVVILHSRECFPWTWRDWCSPLGNWLSDKVGRAVTFGLPTCWEGCICILLPMCLLLLLCLHVLSFLMDVLHPCQEGGRKLHLLKPYICKKPSISSHLIFKDPGPTIVLTPKEQSLFVLMHAHTSSSEALNSLLCLIW